MNLARLFWKTAFWLLVVLTVVMSLIHVEQVPSTLVFWDKAQHALGFAALAVLGLLAYPKGGPHVLVGLLVLGVAIECAQALTGWRHGDWMDALADAVGIAVGTGAVAMWARIRGRTFFFWIFRHMNFKLKHPLRTLLTGVLALLPLAATLLLLSWLWSVLAVWLGPGSAFGQMLTGIGLGLTESEVIGYLLGLTLVVVLVYAFGLMVERGLEQGIARLLDTLLQRIPVVRTVYDVAQKLVGLLSRKDDEELQSMSPVWLYFGGKPGSEAVGSGVGAGRQGTAVLGFLSTPQAVIIGGMPYLGVLVPTAPVPVGGGLLYVPPDWVEPADIGMEGVTSIYVSMGVTSDQYLKKSGL